MDVESINIINDNLYNKYLVGICITIAVNKVFLVSCSMWD